MKFLGKKISACVVLVAMLCTIAVTGFATTDVAITQVQVLSNDGTAFGDPVTNFENPITISDDKLLQVTITAPANKDVSFISYEISATAETLGDDTIQYIEQDSLAEDGNLIFTFRPRQIEGTNFIAKVGAKDIEPISFTYNVVASAPALSINAVDPNAESGRVDDTVKFTIASSDSILPTAEALNVYIDYADEQSVALAKDGSAYTYNSTTGEIEILNSAVGSVGNHTVTVSAEGYNMPAIAANYEVTAFVESPIEGEEEEKAAQDAVNNIVHTVEKLDGYQKINMADTVITIDEEAGKTVTVKHTFNYDNNDVALTVQDGKLVYDESAREKFASKVTITSAVVGDDDVSKTETVYFIPDDVQISFGNLTAIAKSDDPMADAFASDEGIAAISTGDKSDALTIALNVTMGRGTFNDVARATDTIDYVKDGKFVLAEYRIIKLLMDGIYTYDEVYNAREGWQPQP